MAEWTVANVRFIAPEFTLALVDDVTVQGWIDIAERRVSSSAFGDVYKDAGAYLTAHLMALAGVPPYNVGNGAGSGAVGAITGITVGQVSVQYGSNSSVSSVLRGNPSLGLTRYGLLYAELLGERLLGIIVL